VTRSSPGDPAFCHVESQAHFFVITDGKWYTIADDTTGNAGHDQGKRELAAFTNNLPRNNPAATSFFSGYNEVSLVDASVLQTVSSTAFVSEDSGTGETTYAPVHDALIVHPQFASHITIRYINRVGSNGVTLQTVVDDVAGWCGLTGHDSSALTQTVLGYSVSQGTGKDMIGPLLDIHDVDPRPHDFTVEFKPRGSASSGTLLTEDFVRNDPRYTVTIKQDTDLPRKLTFNFADIDHEQQPNNAIAQRPFDAVDTTREETIDLSTYADTVDGAQQKADRYLRRIWNSREGVKNSLTAQSLALEPGDVKTLSLDGTLRNVRLDKLTIGQGSLDCEWVRDEVSVAAVNSATTGATMDASDPQTIFIPAMTRGFFIDAPLVRDADNDVNPVLYYAAGSYGGTSSGALVYEADTQIGTISSADMATWGLTTSALGTADPNLWDRGNSVNVTVFGTLTSATEAEIDADTTLNLIALGDDDRLGISQLHHGDADGDGDGSYTLSGLKRGRRGTEWACGGHAVGEAWILASSLDPRGDGHRRRRRQARSFKAQAIGRSLDTAPEIDVDPTPGTR
jgi:hypothetical protein